MLKINVTNWQGEKVEEIELPSDVFEIKPNKNILYPAIIRANSVYKANYGHAKGRSEVSGGGIKPWKQKGTGRARASSNRSQLWVGGGIAFAGGLKKSFTSRFNSVELKKAICMMLSDFIRNEKVKVIDEILDTKKTKDFNKELIKFKSGKTSIVSTKDIIAARNLKDVNVVKPGHLGITSLIFADDVILEKDSIDILVGRL